MRLRGYVCLSTDLSIKTRIMNRLVTAKSKNEWISVNALCAMSGVKKGTAFKTLQRLLSEGLIERKIVKPPKGRFFFLYRASELGQVRHELGSLPTGSRIEHKEFDVLVRTITDILDPSRVKWELRQVVITLDPYVSSILRKNCTTKPKPKKKDRAEQVTYAEPSFTITITNTAIATVILRDPMIWDTSMTNWMKKTGLSNAAIQTVIRLIRNQLPAGFTRAEVPILEHAIKRLQVECHVETLVKGVLAVESNINYSMNEIGLEYFGMTQWVDALIRTLISFQHSTVVSETARDEWIKEAYEVLEKIRREEQEKEEKKRGVPNYVI